MHLDPKWVQNWDAAVPFCASPHPRIFFSCCISHLVRLLVGALPQGRIAAPYQGLRAVSLLQSKALFSFDVFFFFVDCNFLPLC